MDIPRVSKFAQFASNAIAGMLAVAILVLLASGNRLNIPTEAFSVIGTLMTLILGKMILKNREVNVEVNERLLKEIHSQIKELIEVTTACLPRQQREKVKKKLEREG